MISVFFSWKTHFTVMQLSERNINNLFGSNFHVEYNPQKQKLVLHMQNINTNLKHFNEVERKFSLNIMFLSVKIFIFLTSKILLGISLLVKFEYLYARESYFFSIDFSYYIHFILKQSQYQSKLAMFSRKLLGFNYIYI